MASQFNAPILIPHGSDPQALQRISLSGDEARAYYDEAWLQRLVFEHAETLPIDEIDRAYAGAVPICTELWTPAGAIDVLYATPQGKLVVLEAKLWRNPEARRKVVGQVLDYAKELSRWTYEDLQREINRATGSHGDALLDKVVEASGDMDRTAFIDEVSRSLRQGRFLILICGDGIREGVAMITDFIQRHGTLQFTFGLVEMAVYRMPNRGLLVQPRVLAQSLIVKRTVVSLESEGLVALDEDEAEEDLDDFAKYCLRFWTELIDRLKLDDTSVPRPKPTRGGTLFLKMPKGSGGARLILYCLKKDEQVGVLLVFSPGPLADRVFESLREDRREIDEELEVPIQWTPEDVEDGKHRVQAYKNFPDIRDPRYRDDIMAFLADRANRFVNAFRARIERIVEEL
ncbi:MAG: DUF4268 domain-containing protein [Proteobacteria bacterium]|nr:DUF4268 domain-containing protein [Pseudomonadota bacterium]MYJ96134.1 DUF4268 domain-containing protein [Pseudomonadota bacterium]